MNELDNIDIVSSDMPRKGQKFRGIGTTNAEFDGFVTDIFKPNSILVAVIDPKNPSEPPLYRKVRRNRDKKWRISSSRIEIEFLS